MSLFNLCNTNEYDNAPSLWAEVERLDLLLQHHYYRQFSGCGDEVIATFLLPEDEVLHRLSMPYGYPHWMDGKQPVLTNDIRQPQENLLLLLCKRFELTSFEQGVVVMGLLTHFEPRYTLLFSCLQNDRRKEWPTIHLALSLLASGSEKEYQQMSFLPQSPLIASGLITLNKSAQWGQQPFMTTDSVFHYFAGHRYLTGHMARCIHWQLPSGSMVGKANATLIRTLEQVVLCPHNNVRPLLIVRSQEPDLTERQIVDHLGGQTLVLDITALPDDTEKTLHIVSYAILEVRMRDAYLIMRHSELLMEKSLMVGLVRLFNRPGLRMIGLQSVQTPTPSLGHLPIVQIEAGKQTSDEKYQLMQALLPTQNHADIDMAMLSQRYAFNAISLPSILQEAYYYQQQRQPDSALQEMDLQKALQLRAQQNFGQLAHRITPKRTFQDLILSDALAQQLHELIVALRWREHILDKRFAKKVGYGKGVSALFYGDSGTGKTMAAEVIASQLGVDLIKVDLANVVNKYIGETEKNLARIFDLAELDAGVLFFDEADALFGKRSEAKDAKDRHANIEVSYLLQRLENHPGLVILATNNRSHLDNAFSRRFTFITRFTFPDATLREKMWRAIWPEQTVLSRDVDFSSLANKAEITGANIRNIAVLSSMFAAGDKSGEVMLHHIEKAMKRELAKIGRVMM